MIRFDDLGLFVRSAALGSFSRAAREADLLPGQVSAAIGRLERELGIRLFARSTRSLRLTAEGEAICPMPARCWRPCAKGASGCRGRVLSCAECCRWRRLRIWGAISCCPGWPSFVSAIPA